MQQESHTSLPGDSLGTRHWSFMSPLYWVLHHPSMRVIRNGHDETHRNGQTKRVPKKETKMLKTWACATARGVCNEVWWCPFPTNRPPVQQHHPTVSSGREQFLGGIAWLLLPFVGAFGVVLLLHPFFLCPFWVVLFVIILISGGACFPSPPWCVLFSWWKRKSGVKYRKVK